MSRQVHAQSVVYDQVDFFLGTNRISVPITSLESKLFVNNQLLPWTLEDGTTVLDISIAATKIYYNEIAGSPGYNSIRFFPDRIGFWRLSIKYSTIEIIKEYDILGTKSSSGGLNASFTP
jgi:hypothetical protein